MNCPDLNVQPITLMDLGLKPSNFPDLSPKPINFPDVGLEPIPGFYRSPSTALPRIFGTNYRTTAYTAYRATAGLR